MTRRLRRSASAPAEVENAGSHVEPISVASVQIVVDEIAEAIGAAVAAIGQAGMDLAGNVPSHIVADALGRIAFEDLDRAPDLARGDVDDDLTQRIARDIGLDEGVTGVRRSQP